MGFEPTTISLGSWNSTAELHPQYPGLSRAKGLDLIAPSRRDDSAIAYSWVGLCPVWQGVTLGASPASSVID